jgi:hypothetical protein
MTKTAFGTAVGLALGFAVVFGSFGDMLIVALFGALGFGIAKIVSGEFDILPYLSGRRDQR